MPWTAEVSTHPPVIGKPRLGSLFPAPESTLALDGPKHRPGTSEAILRYRCRGVSWGHEQASKPAVGAAGSSIVACACGVALALLAHPALRPSGGRRRPPVRPPSPALCLATVGPPETPSSGPPGRSRRARGARGGRSVTFELAPWLGRRGKASSRTADDLDVDLDAGHQETTARRPVWRAGSTLRPDGQNHLISATRNVAQSVGQARDAAPRGKTGRVLAMTSNTRSRAKLGQPPPGPSTTQTLWGMVCVVATSHCSNGPDPLTSLQPREQPAGQEPRRSALSWNQGIAGREMGRMKLSNRGGRNGQNQQTLGLSKPRGRQSHEARPPSLQPV
jgi:hypothetical protein